MCTTIFVNVYHKTTRPSEREPIIMFSIVAVKRKPHCNMSEYIKFKNYRCDLMFKGSTLKFSHLLYTCNLYHRITILNNGTQRFKICLITTTDKRTYTPLHYTRIWKVRKNYVSYSLTILLGNLGNFSIICTTKPLLTENQFVLSSLPWNEHFSTFNTELFSGMDIFVNLTLNYFCRSDL